MAAVVCRIDSGFVLQIEVPCKDSMLDAEEAIPEAPNRAGVAATEEALTRFDADGAPIHLGPLKLTSMGKVHKQYQTPYGVATVERHVYQGSKGGKTYCPLDRDARSVVRSTPRFARMIAHKYAEFGAGRVLEDLAENHGRRVAKAFVRDVADAVAPVALAKEEDWQYELPRLDAQVATVTIGLDGTCLLMCEDGWREAMVGSIGFYDKDGERLHTIYTAATPEYGKLTFLERFDREIDRVKAAYPEARYVGVADGARDNWLYLDLKTEVQVVDFFHATQYLWAAADPLFPDDATGLRPWIDSWCHRLKHEPGAARALIAELETRGAALVRKRLPAEVDSALTYFRNQLKGGRMAYAELVAEHIPIGSGMTEAACKVLVKQRLCGSGMRWKERGAAAVLAVRSLAYTPERWAQFWSRVDRSGFPVAA
ncbi:ISKra4 family transposase [Tautonia plasticadhaerens]|uniref:ISKra4 family transposase n=1 Tax=Tautonia plasticadhaerens TaxID=2527974 RepID=A0A518HF55_9BACT|nr:ISKra4 family transposase [Tautonia plasticadhaerens]QDV39474.1 hypothetical protein ElP_74410 [Tautonia plasticadhaerens]